MGNLSKEEKFLKKNHVVLGELKHKITKIRSLVDELSSRIEMTKIESENMRTDQYNLLNLNKK